ncbi:MAG: InlB B-repeat-containing protein [Clostridiales bacterium]|jgi:hypothetical protein|nr:InlB B-repeat-containing protein [Clostridiales bacterium]
MKKTTALIILLALLFGFFGGAVQSIQTALLIHVESRVRSDELSFTISFEKIGNFKEPSPVRAVFGEIVPEIEYPAEGAMTQTGRFGGYFDQPNGNGNLYYRAMPVYKDDLASTGDKVDSLRDFDKMSDVRFYPGVIKRNNDIQTQDVILNPNYGHHKDSTRESNYLTVTNQQPMPSGVQAPVRYGYDFMGYWDDDTIGILGKQYYDENMNSVSDVNFTNFPPVLNARWVRNSETLYNVYFDANGGMGGSPSVLAMFGKTMPQATAAIRDGYSFLGYFSTQNGGVQYYDKDMNSVKDWDKTGDATLYANWGKEYRVTLDATGGTGGTISFNVFVGSPMPKADAPSRVGYTFLGYYDAKDGGNQYYDKDMKSVKDWDKPNDTTLYARWLGNSYKVIFSNEGGNGESGVSVVFGSPMPKADAPNRTGYIFLGYYDSWTGTGGVQYYDQDMKSVRDWDKTKDSTLYARWTGQTYTIILDATGGTGGTGSVNVVFQSSMPKADAPSRKGYTFLGYYDYKTGGAQYYDQDMKSVRSWNRADDATLYAQWSVIEYKVELDANGGISGTAQVVATFGSAMPKAEGPSRAGYAFLGFYLAQSGGAQYYDRDMKSIRDWDQEKDSTLYANWAKLYKVTLDANGGVGGSISVEVYLGGAMPKANAPSMAGSTFLGYYDNQVGGAQYYDQDMKSVRDWDKASDAKLYARWVANIYKVTLDANGGVGSSISVEVYLGGEMPKVDAPSRVGYTFLGYYDSQIDGEQYYDGDMNSVRNWDKTDDATLYARWIVRDDLSFTISFEKFENINYPPPPPVKAVFGEIVPEIGPITAGESTMTKSGRFGGYFDQPNGNGNLYYGAISGTKDDISSSRDKVGSLRDFDKMSDVRFYPGVIKRNNDTQTQDVILNPNYGHHKDSTRESNYLTVTNQQPMPSGVPAPVRYGYDFMGYWDDDFGEDVQYYDGNMNSVRVVNWKNFPRVLHARWVKNNDVLYNVTLDANGGYGGTGSVEVPMGSVMPQATASIRPGYTFMGYYDAKDGGNQYYDKDMNSVRDWDKVNDTTLYAHWVSNIYKVTLDVNGGTGGTGSVEVPMDSAMPKVDAPSRDGYTFGGYYDAKDGGNQYYDKDMNSVRDWDKVNDTTLYARWSKDDTDENVNNSNNKNDKVIWFIVGGVGVVVIGVLVVTHFVVKRRKVR